MINYELIERIHISEHNSRVLKVKNKDTEEVCALKLIGQLSDKLNRLIFKREIAALRKLNQFDDIVKLYDSSDQLRYNKQSGYGAILLELIEGQPLSRVDLSSYSDLDKIDICRNSAYAVLHAHQCDILHRDIKPSNIMLIDGLTKIKMIDFGNSKLKAIVDECTTHHIFSSGYVAPEVARGQEPTELSDIYSLGAVFYYVFFLCSPVNTQSEDVIMSAGIVPEMQRLLIRMLMLDPAERFEDMQEVVDSLDTIIGSLNTNAFNYCFHVDTGKLEALKRQYTVEKAMTYQQFLSVYLPQEFNTISGIYNSKKELYEFIGNNLYMECAYDEKTRQFTIANLYEIPIDKRSKLQRIFGIIEGKKEFIGFGKPLSGKNDNRKLKTQLHNYADERNSLQSKNELFEDIFGKWRQSIQESIETIKDKSIQIEYSDYWFEQDRLSLCVESVKGIEIDSITPETSFLFDTPDNPKRKTISVGRFDDYFYDDEKSIMVLKLDRYATQDKLTPLLQTKAVLLEDYTKKIGAFRKQLAAITALKNGDYNTAGLKDIILELVSPTLTHSIQSLRFLNSRLNDSQKQAVKKAIYSNSISLIQGPPGTGKTSVITELIQQIMTKAAVSDAHPKILIVSQSHTAVDNILEKLSSWKEAKQLNIVRIGKNDDVSADVASRYLIDAIRDDIYANIQALSPKYVDEKITLLSPNNSDDEKAAESKKTSLLTWGKAKAIHEDWLKRCGDYSSLRYQIVNTATIIAGTCIGFLSDENVRDMIFDYVIVDEAAKATTPELLVSIIKADKIVLVGDQNQLSPFADGALSELAVSLVKDPQYRLFDILYDSLPDTHKQFLATQYRMCSTIGNLISTVFYEGKIITGVSDEERQHTIPRFAGKSIVWINTSGVQNHASRRVPGGSSYNQIEVNIIRKLLGEMNAQDDASNLDVGIITAYKAQKDSIYKAFRNGSFKNIGNVDINTLDAFQGRENNIIIYSTVRTDGNIVFLQEKERVNVAFSRAKKLLVICGDMDFIETWTGARNYFIEIVQYLRNNTNTCQIADAREVLR